MGDILDRISAAVDDLCPCGADPQPGSIYCGDDCRPTHISRDTDTSSPGTYGAQSTAMRWRPDLVSEVDDIGLTLIDEFRFRRYNARIHASATWLHVRLDDGYRWVGADLDIPWNGSTDPTDLPADLREGVDPIWAKLERQLTDTRLSEPDPWAGAWPGAIASFRYRPGDIVHAADLIPLPPGFGIRVVGADLTGIEDSTSAIQAAINNSAAAFVESMERSLAEAVQSIAPALSSFADGIGRFNAEHTRFVRIAREEPEDQPAHPMLTALEARRNRNTGPEQRQRAPRQIGPRRTR